MKMKSPTQCGNVNIATLAAEIKHSVEAGMNAGVNLHWHGLVLAFICIFCNLEAVGLHVSPLLFNEF